MTFLKSIKPLIITFIIVIIFLLIAQPYFTIFYLQIYALLVANFLIMVLSGVTFIIQKKALYNKNPNVYFRSVMMAMLLKMVIIIIGLLVCIAYFKHYITKPTICLTMLLYFIYLAIEVTMANKINKQKNG